jgi:RNA recognition motif-containing protein
MLAPIGAKTLFIFSLFLIVFTFSLGFAFVYFEDERDGDEAIRALDGYPFGPGRRRLSVEWSRGDRGSRSPKSPSRLPLRPPLHETTTQVTLLLLLGARL